MLKVASLHPDTGDVPVHRNDEFTVADHPVVTTVRYMISAPVTLSAYRVHCERGLYDNLTTKNGVGSAFVATVGPGHIFGMAMQAATMRSALTLGRSRNRRASRPLRVALVGYFGEGNFGNEASLEAMVAQVRSPGVDCEITCICHVPDRVSQRTDLKALPFLAPYRPSGRGFVARIAGRLADVVWSLQSIRKQDVVIVPGTGILENLYSNAGGALQQLLLLAVASRMWRRPFIIVSVGADRFDKRSDRLVVTLLCTSAAYLTTRDKHSADALANMSSGRITPRIRPDLAIGLPAPRGIPHEERTVVLGVMAYEGGLDGSKEGRAILDHYVDRIASVTSSLLQDGYLVKLMGGDDDDHATAKLIRDRVVSRLPGIHNPDRVVVLKQQRFEDVLNACAAADAVIATRYHNIVGALKTRTPAISIGYGPKNEEVMRGVGLAAFCHMIHDFEPSVIINDLDTLIRGRDEYIELIDGGMAAQEAGIAEQQEDIHILLASIAHARRVGSS